MPQNPSSKFRFSVSGTGSQVAVFRFHGRNVSSSPSGGTVDPNAGVNKSGRVTAILVRQDAGGGATAFDYTLVDGNYATPDTITYASIPDEYIVSEGVAVATTASATAASLNSTIDAKPTYRDSLAIVFNVTGAGAWTLLGHLTVET